MTNSRMKDYYDLWFMSGHFEFEGSTLAAAVRATFERRRTEIPRRAPIALTTEYAADLNHVRQWGAFTKSLGVEAPLRPFSRVRPSAIGMYTLRGSDVTRSCSQPVSVLC